MASERNTATPARPGPGRRVALVVGNGLYGHAATLDNPPNDARAVARTLAELDFEVIEGVDLDIRGLDERISRFARRIEGAETALFFYAGHGLQVDGENYLVPVDAELEHEGQLQRQTIRLQDQLAMMSSKASVNILLLDCCRDNPFVRSLARRRTGATRGVVAPGLAEVGVDEGSFIAFATGPGSVAKDGEGPHSPFTEALLAHMTQPDQSLADIMTDVTNAVTAATGETQVPWYHSSLRRRFYFKRTGVSPPIPGGPGPAGSQEAAGSALPPPESPTMPPIVSPKAAADGAEPPPVVQPPSTEAAGIAAVLPETIEPPAEAPAQAVPTGRSVAAQEGGMAAPVRRSIGRRIAPALAIALLLGAVPVLYLTFAPAPIVLPAAPPVSTGESLLARLGSLDDTLVADVARFMGDPVDDPARSRLVRDLALMAQSALVSADASAAIPDDCRAPTPPRPGVDAKLTLICTGLAAPEQARLLAMLATVPADLWQRLPEERGLARLAVADAQARRRALPDSLGPQSTADLARLSSNLSPLTRPGNLVTLQFGGAFQRGNAQAIMDRLVSFGWAIAGVQRAASAAGLDEIRYGDRADTATAASDLLEDMSLQGLGVAAKPNAAIGAQPQLDIYLSTPLAVWGQTEPDRAWCYQEYDAAKPMAQLFLVACHPTRPACLAARGTAPGKKQSECRFVDGIASSSVTLSQGGWSASWYVYGPGAMGTPFPPLD